MVGVRDAVTALFVPGDRADRFPKALGSGADVVILDLEDAVSPADKTVARANVKTALESGNARFVVRINPQQTSWHEDDLTLIDECSGGGGLLGVMIPKAESARSMEEIRGRVASTVDLIPLIETARGVAAAVEIGSAPGVARLSFGAIDFALDVDSWSETVLDHARCELVIASRVSELTGPLDSPSVQIKDTNAVAASARRARDLGFGGKLCIHPAQLDPVKAGFVPSDNDIEWARQVLETDTESASQVAGLMVDRPVVERARRIMATNATAGGVSR